MRVYRLKVLLQVMGRLHEELEIALVANSQQEAERLIRMYLNPLFTIKQFTLLEPEPEGV